MSKAFFSVFLVFSVVNSSASNHDSALHMGRKISLFFSVPLWWILFLDWLPDFLCALCVLCGEILLARTTMMSMEAV